MATLELDKLSFNAGIWTNLLSARKDLARYAAACSDMLNFIPHPFGGISNRSGFEFIFSIGSKKVKLVSFKFNDEQSYVLAFYAGGGVILQNGKIINAADKTPYIFSHPYAEEHLRELDYIQSADVLYIVHSQYPPAQLVRAGAHNNWTYSVLPFECSVPTPRQLTVVPIANTGEEYTYGITLVDDNGNESMLLESSSTARLGDRLEFGNVPEYYNCQKYNIYRMSGGVFGWVGDTQSLYWVDPNAEINNGEGQGGTDPDMEARPPIVNNPFQGAGNYPRCVTIHRGRLVMGGSINNPLTFCGSRAGSFTDFSSRYPLQADDSYEWTVSNDLVKGRVDPIVWMQSTHKGLLLGTGGGIHLAGDKMTALEPDISPQNDTGCEAIPPVMVGTDILFVQKGKNIIQGTQYDALTEQFTENNRALLADNLFNSSHKLTAIAWQRDPDYILWATRDDGILLGMTYIKDEKVWAWHKHQTQGKITDIAVITNRSGESQLFISVERNSQTCLESMRSRDLGGDINNAWFLDSAVEYAGEATTNFKKGLEHLEGMTVSMFSAGSVTEGLTVTGGQISFPTPVTSAVVGLPYSSTVSTMDAVPPQHGRYTQSVINSLVGVTVKVLNSCAGRISGTGGDDMSKWKPVTFSRNHDIAAPYTLTEEGTFYFTISNEAKLTETEVPTIKVHIANDLPLPLTISSIGMRVNIGDL